MAPGSTWKRWRTGERVVIVKGKVRGCAAWCFVKVEDNEDIRIAFDKSFVTGVTSVDQYGEVLKSGWGENPPADVAKEIKEKYFVNYDCTG